MSYLFQTPVISIVGPTASGKSGVAIEIAKRLNGEIVSVDPLQVYRHFDIGTGKVTLEEQSLAPHHLIDIVAPDKEYNAADFQADADRVIAEIHARGHVPILAGGTGLYLKALLHGLFDTPSDQTLRESLRARAEAEGLLRLYRELQDVDPKAAEKISSRDAVRIIRALEVFQLTGSPFSSLAAQHQHGERRYPVLTLGLMWPRPVLYERIVRRVEMMFQEGWSAEVEMLRGMGYGPELKPMQCIGYREINAVLAGELDAEILYQRVCKQTKAYAKRQLTWFRKEAVSWFPSPQALLEDAVLPQEIESFLAAPETYTPPAPLLQPKKE